MENYVRFISIICDISVIDLVLNEITSLPKQLEDDKEILLESDGLKLFCFEDNKEDKDEKTNTIVSKTQNSGKTIKGGELQKNLLYLKEKILLDKPIETHSCINEIIKGLRKLNWKILFCSKIYQYFITVPDNIKIFHNHVNPISKVKIEEIKNKIIMFIELVNYLPNFKQNSNIRGVDYYIISIIRFIRNCLCHKGNQETEVLPFLSNYISTMLGGLLIFNDAEYCIIPVRINYNINFDNIIDVWKPPFIVINSEDSQDVLLNYLSDIVLDGRTSLNRFLNSIKSVKTERENKKNQIKLLKLKV